MKGAHAHTALSRRRCCFVRKGRKKPSAAPGTWGGQEPSRFPAAHGPSESARWGVGTAPGLGSTYCVPLANSSQHVFSAGWYLQEGLLARAHCVCSKRLALATASACPHDVVPRGLLLPRSGWVCFLTQQGPGFGKFLLHTLHEGAGAPRPPFSRPLTISGDGGGEGRARGQRKMYAQVKKHVSCLR